MDISGIRFLSCLGGPVHFQIREDPTPLSVSALRGKRWVSAFPEGDWFRDEIGPRHIAHPYYLLKHKCFGFGTEGLTCDRPSHARARKNTIPAFNLKAVQAAKRQMAKSCALPRQAGPFVVVTVPSLDVLPCAAADV